MQGLPLGLSRCAAEYATALADPAGVDEACLPVSTLAMTRKVKVWAKGSGSTGTSTYGFALASPFSAIDKAQDTVYASNSSYTGTTMSNVPGSTIEYAISNSPFGTANFVGPTDGGGLQARLVCCELRIRNTTPLLNRGGSAALLVHPDHLSLNGLSYTDLLSYNSVVHVGFASDKWLSVKWNGVANPAEEGFYNGETDRGFMSLANTPPCMAAMVNASTLQTFDYEFYAHFELVGREALGKTPTWADPQAVGVVNTAASIASQNAGGASHSSPAWRSKFLHYIKEGARMALPYVVPAAKVAVAGYFGGPAAAGAAVMSQLGQGKTNNKKAIKSSKVARPRLAIKGK
jgi:hypothetical protein